MNERESMVDVKAVTIYQSEESAIVRVKRSNPAKERHQTD